MPEIQCKYVHRVGQREYLRIFWGDIEPDAHEGWGYHDCQTKVRDIIGITTLEESNAIHDASQEEYNKYIGQWPTKCQRCNEVPPPYGTDGAHYDMFYEWLYDDPPRELEPGDIFDAKYLHNSDDSYAVMLPNKHFWYTYMIASNCTHPDTVQKNDKGEVVSRTIHKCWTSTGTPPNLDVNPSIAMGYANTPGYWHGHLRNGKLIW